MLIALISILVIGVGAIASGFVILFGKKKPKPKEIKVVSRPGSVIKVNPSVSSSMFPPGVGKSLDPDYLVMGAIFNTQGEEPGSLGEIELMTHLSTAFREGKVSAGLVKIAEERVNLFVNDEIWNEFGGRQSVMEKDRDAKLASMRYTEFIYTLKKILNDSSDMSVKYLDDEDRSYDNVVSSEEEVVSHEDYSGLEHNPDINAIPVKDFEMNNEEAKPEAEPKPAVEKPEPEEQKKEEPAKEDTKQEEVQPVQEEKAESTPEAAKEETMPESVVSADAQPEEAKKKKLLDPQKKASVKENIRLSISGGGHFSNVWDLLKDE